MADSSIDQNRYCDLIMKGGITSGVVYPKVITTLAKDYHFKSVGGASAGAIAAAMAAAAEFARVTGRTGDGVGMAGIDALPQQFSGGVLSYFQPVKPLRRLFGLGMDAMALSKSGGAGFRPMLKVAQAHYKAILPLWFRLLWLAFVGGAGYALWLYKGWIGLVVVGLAAILLLIVAIGLGAKRLALSVMGDVTKGIPDNRFGICSGRTEDGDPTKPGLTDWLTDALDKIAGLQPGEGPITFRMLQNGPAAKGLPGINLQIMTTNMSMQRPHRLPMDTAIFYFEESEFRELFPDHIVDHMINVAKAHNQAPIMEEGKIFWRFPGNQVRGMTATIQEMICR